MTNKLLGTKEGNRQARRAFKKAGRDAKRFFTKDVVNAYNTVDRGAKQGLSFLEKNADEIGLLAGSVGAIVTGDPTMVAKGLEMGNQVKQTAGEVQQMRGQIRKDLNQTGKNIARSARNDPIEMPTMTTGSMLQGARSGLKQYGENVLAQQQQADMFI